MAMSDLHALIKQPAQETQEKHVPHIEVTEGGLVKVSTGRDVMHPSTVEHHMVWLKLFGLKADGNLVEVGSVNLAPVYSSPSAVFAVKVAEFTALKALAYCNIHGLWENSLAL
jgi:superoxide reductase